MDATTHQITCSIINQTVPGDGVFTNKSAGNNIKFVMTAIFRPGVTGVAM